MSNPQNSISALVTGGLGAAIGGILTAVIQVLSRSGESRATAAELVTRAAGTLVERLEKENADLRARLETLEHKEQRSEMENP